MTTLTIRSPRSELREISDDHALRSIDQQIGQELRALYDEVLAEPIPPRLLALMDELESVETATSNSKAETVS